ncbi:MAG: hypothetical protein PHZ07_00115 [Patescibacteria group bacterium]|nr:hypothetical protein [Patescibacteria group bacterium]MDD4304138.1 hypothetical protein [Patescibacteria group bacterium]MDD4695169.1 hypothetical protein [Patescibacteria group bacterium]
MKAGIVHHLGEYVDRCSRFFEKEIKGGYAYFYVGNKSGGQIFDFFSKDVSNGAYSQLLAFMGFVHEFRKGMHKKNVTFSFGSVDVLIYGISNKNHKRAMAVVILAAYAKIVSNKNVFTEILQQAAKIAQNNNRMEELIIHVFGEDPFAWMD